MASQSDAARVPIGGSILAQDDLDNFKALRQPEDERLQAIELIRDMELRATLIVATQPV